MLIVFAILLGAFAGSLTNALALRTKAGLPLMSRAKCLSCVEPVAWFDAIPVLSYVALKGRCRRCSAAIEWQYPAVEAAMALLFGLFALRLTAGWSIPAFISSDELWLLFVRDALLSVFMVVIFLYDFRFSHIPDKFSVPALVIALVLNLALGAPAAPLLLGGLLIGAFFAVQFLVSKGEWIGGGDIRLGLLMGFLLGLPLGIVALFLSYIFGAIAGVLLVSFGQRTLHSHVPFGTFLTTAIIVTMLWGQEVLQWYAAFLS